MVQDTLQHHVPPSTHSLILFLSLHCYVLHSTGDAILAVWRVNDDTELNATVDQVVKCCLNIQDRCGAWETDIGVTLTVKMGNVYHKYSLKDKKPATFAKHCLQKNHKFNNIFCFALNFFLR